MMPLEVEHRVRFRDFCQLARSDRAKRCRDAAEAVAAFYRELGLSILQ